MVERLRRLWSMALLSAKYFLFMLAYCVLFLGVPMSLGFGVGVAWSGVVVLVFHGPVPEEGNLLVVFLVASVSISVLFVYLAHRAGLAERSRSWFGLPAVAAPAQRAWRWKPWSLRELFPRVHMKWREPRAVRRVVIAAEQKDDPRGTAAAFIGFWMGMLAFVAILNGVLTGEMLLLRLVVIFPAVIAFCLFLTYVLIPLPMKLIASTIKVTDRLIVRDPGVRAVWRYERIAKCDIVKRQFDGFDAFVLRISLHDDSEHSVGIADTVRLTDLQRLLSDHGVQVSLDEKTRT